MILQLVSWMSGSAKFRAKGQICQHVLAYNPNLALDGETLAFLLPCLFFGWRI